ncbi:MAG: pentapeptide repeat-containing protein [Acidiferrobacterales bacterium]
MTNKFVAEHPSETNLLRAAGEMKERAITGKRQTRKSARPSGTNRLQRRRVSTAELKKVIKTHENWLESEETEGEQASLQGASLQGADLSGANLQRADFSASNLTRANLQRTNLQVTNLQDANLQGADLSNAKLELTVFIGANLQEANLHDASLTQTILIDANLRKATLSDANLWRALLFRASLKEANLHGASLREADLREADLTDVTNLQGASLAGADTTNARLPEDIREFKVLSLVEEISKNARKIFVSMLLASVYAWLTIATTPHAQLLTNSATSLPIIGTEIPIAYFYSTAPIILVALYVYLHFYLQRLWQGLARLPACFPDGQRLDERAYPWLFNGLVRRHFWLLSKRSPIAKFEELITIVLAWWVVPITLYGLWIVYLPRHEWWGTGLHIVLLVLCIAAGVIFYVSAARTLRGDEPLPSSWKTVRQDRGSLVIGLAVVLLFLGNLLWVSFREMNGDSRYGAYLVEADVSTKPTDFWQLSPQERNNSIKGANLRGRNLRHARAVRAFLANADLREADLSWADLEGANLQRANLSEAHLQGANLTGTNLQNAKGLTQKQLAQACGDTKTKLPPGLSIKLCSENK